MLVTGVLLASPFDRDPPLDYTKIAVKAVIAVLIFVAVLVVRKKETIGKGHFLGIVGMTLLNAAIAVFCAKSSSAGRPRRLLTSSASRTISVALFQQQKSSKQRGECPQCDDAKAGPGAVVAAELRVRGRAGEVHDDHPGLVRQVLRDHLDLGDVAQRPANAEEQQGSRIDQGGKRHCATSAVTPTGKQADQYQVKHRADHRGTRVAQRTDVAPSPACAAKKVARHRHGRDGRARQAIAANLGQRTNRPRCGTPAATSGWSRSSIRAPTARTPNTTSAELAEGEAVEGGEQRVEDAGSSPAWSGSRARPGRRSRAETTVGSSVHTVDRTVRIFVHSASERRVIAAHLRSAA